jgi:hypothetical protein
LLYGINEGEGGIHLHGVDSNIYAAIHESIVDLLGEEPFPSDVCQGLVQDLVPCSLDDHYLQGALLLQLRKFCLKTKSTRSRTCHDMGREEVWRLTWAEVGGVRCQRGGGGQQCGCSSLQDSLVRSKPSKVNKVMEKTGALLGVESDAS